MKPIARETIVAPLVARPLAELAETRTVFEAVLPLVHEAGNPYWDWFFGGAERGRAAVVSWVDRPSSELAAERITVFMRGRRLAGVVVAVGGAELGLCRKADTIAAIAEAGEERTAIVERLAAARRLFLPVPGDGSYLSRIAVAPRLRGRGLGRSLMQAFLEVGSSAGFGRFYLDVSADNTAAIRLYESFGFRVEATMQAAGMRYLRMARLGD